MGSFKAKFNDKAVRGLERKLNKLKTPLTSAETNKIGKNMVKAMKRLIAKGIFPIRGGGWPKRFPRYKRANDPRGYPNTVKRRFPSKRKRPVNLKLSGAFMKDLGHKVLQGGKRGKNIRIEIGYDKAESILKEKGHREGANSQPKRPTIPNPRRKERFAAKVRDEYFKVLLKKFDKITKKRN